MSVNQKGTALTGDALTEEVLASSDSILQSGTYGKGIKGLQQFFTPDEAARLAVRVIGDGVSVFDPTAGDGSLLKMFNPSRAFGVEIDKDQIKNNQGRYNALQGDFQEYYPLLKMGQQPWPAIVANPPFGHQWETRSIREGKPTNSTVFTFIAINRLLEEEGQYMFICGRNRFDRQVLSTPDAGSIYAVIDCDDMFEGTTLPCVIAFGVHEAARNTEKVGILGRRTLSLDMLDLAADWVKEMRQESLNHWSSLTERDYYAHQRVEQFATLQKEYNKRVEKKGFNKDREYDAGLYNGSHIQWLPSAFTQLALKQNNLYYDFRGLDKQPITYFAQNEKLWNQLVEAMEMGIVTIDPKLFTAVDKIVEDVRKYRIPLYYLKPQQRLGFLQDVDTLLCTKDDLERKFKKGERYRLDTRTKTIVEKEDRMVESRKEPGKWEQKTFEKHKKVMAITLSGGTATRFTLYDGGERASQDIQWLIDHFDIPDVGDLAQRHPEQVEKMEKLVREVLEKMQKNSAEWEEKNTVTIPFTIREFQVRDIARLLVKGYGLLAWEQGLGKTVGGIAFAAATWKLGAKKKVLVVTAADLIPQWTREFERFLKFKPTVIKTHGQAHRIAKKLRTGGKGIYIANYEALAISGTRKSKTLPTVIVKEWTQEEMVKGTGKWNYWVWVNKNDPDKELPHSEDVYRELFNIPKEVEPWQDHFLNAERTAEKGTKVYKLKKGLPIDQMDELGWVMKPVPRSTWKTANGTSTAYNYVPPRTEKKIYKLTSKQICPECHADERNGWNGIFCEAEDDKGQKCGYAHYAVRMKPIAALLSTAFHDGTILLDEITYIQGNTSKRSIALRGLQARYRLGLTGTPIKNYVHQVFWPLAWCLGSGKPWFPYEYDGGLLNFQNDFCVIEYGIGGGRRENRKFLPDVTNLSRFWRMLASCTIRRRAEETGEDLVDIYYHDINVPFSVAQAEQTREWLKTLPHGFPAFFAEKYPDAPVVKAGMHEIMAPLLGLNWKLDYACTLPKADPDWEWTEIDMSNWTPANLKALELTMALVAQGRKVLVGSHIVAEGKWLAEQLQEKGVEAVHIVDESGTTASAKKRAQEVYSFQTDEKVQVFCAGMKAIRLGHNLDAANAVVINGLDFDYETLDQFIKRVRRLTSKTDVDVYVILPTLEGQQTIQTRKWDLLTMKGSAADLALDGRLIFKAEAEISEAEMIRELQQRGFQVTEEAVDESEVKRAWEEIPILADYDLTGVIPKRPDKVENEAKIEEAPDEERPEVEAQVEEQPAVVYDDSALDEDIAEFVVGEEIPEVGEFTGFHTNVELDTDDPEMQPESVVAFATKFDPLVPSSETEATIDESGVTTPEGGGDAEPDAQQTTAAESDLVQEADSATPAPGPAILDPVSTIKGAKELLDIGVITDEEFQAIRTAQLALMGVVA